MLVNVDIFCHIWHICSEKTSEWLILHSSFSNWKFNHLLNESQFRGSWEGWIYWTLTIHQLSNDKEKKVKKAKVKWQESDAARASHPRVFHTNLSSIPKLTLTYPLTYSHTIPNTQAYISHSHSNTHVKPLTDSHTIYSTQAYLSHIPNPYPIPITLPIPTSNVPLTSTYLYLDNVHTNSSIPLIMSNQPC